MKITNALVFDPKEGFVARDFCVKDGLIAADALGPVSAHGCYVIPGLTDLHFHGCVGEDFPTPPLRAFRKWPTMSSAGASPRSARRG